MYHTSLFAEEYPAGLPDILLILCQITFVLALLLGIATVILLVMVLVNKRTRREDSIFLLVGYVIMLISFAVFVIIYPYTCSSDFRYVAICLVYVSIALGLGNKYYLAVPAVSTGERVRAAVMHIINCGTVAFCILITLIYAFWGRW